MMAIFKAIQTQQYRDKVARYKIGLVDGCQLKDAVLGYGWLKTENGIELPDLSQIPTTEPITAIPNQFKTVVANFGYNNGKITVAVETNDFTNGESHLYNIAAIRDEDNEVAFILIGQPAYVSAERPLTISATFEDRIISVEG